MNTRFAPSPTGHFHIGSLRTAYFNWLAAKATGGSFILRIDDTDTERNRPEHEDMIRRVLEQYGLNWDYSFNQSDRLDDYRSYAESLIKRGFAEEHEGCIRLLPQSLNHLSFVDGCVGRICITDQDKLSCNNLVLLKSDGNPTYNFATVVDDCLSDSCVDCIIRGVDHISNTPKQLLIASLFGVNVPEFNHVGLLTDNNGKKISKRDSTADVRYYDSYDTKAVLNWVLRLGWSPTKDDKTTTFIDTDQAIEMFMTQGRMNASNAKINVSKLESLQKHYKK